MLERKNKCAVETKHILAQRQQSKKIDALVDHMAQDLLKSKKKKGPFSKTKIKALKELIYTWMKKETNQKKDINQIYEEFITKCFVDKIHGQPLSAGHINLSLPFTRKEGVDLLKQFPKALQNTESYLQKKAQTEMKKAHQKYLLNQSQKNEFFKHLVLGVLGILGATLAATVTLVGTNLGAIFAVGLGLLGGTCALGVAYLAERIYHRQTYREQAAQAISPLMMQDGVKKQYAHNWKSGKRSANSYTSYLTSFLWHYSNHSLNGYRAWCNGYVHQEKKNAHVKNKPVKKRQ